MGGTERNHENISQDSWSTGQDLDLGPLKYAVHSTIVFDDSVVW
jgi:hypothetical protein